VGLCRAGSSMRLMRLKPQGPDFDRGPEGPDRPVQRKIYKVGLGPHWAMKFLEKKFEVF